MVINKELKQLIEENALALATVDEANNPHCIAVADVKVVSKNQILIGDNYLVETIKNIHRNPNIAIAVWSKNWKKNCIGYELKGTVKYFKTGRWHEMVKKIHKGFPAKGAILVTIKKVKKLA